MKIIRFLSLVFLVTIISVFSGFVASYRAMGVLDSRYQPPEKITYDEFKYLPEEVVFSEARDFANIAWRTFVTLNWPANYDGSPLKEVALGEAPSAPRVWEFYRTPEEVFLADGENPLLNTPSPFSIRTLKLDLIEGQGSGFLQNFDGQTNLEESRKSIEEVNKKIEQINSGIQGEINLISEDKNLSLNKIPLVDRQGNYIIVEIHLNQNEFQQIVDKKWYDASELARFYEKNDFQFKSTKLSDAPIEVKAAWRIFDENSSAAEKARYYTTKRVLAIPKEQYICENGNCVLFGDYVLQEVEVGLIGFHIAYKIPKQQGSNPGWIWSTFEQVDNLKKVDSESLKLQPTLSNPNCEKNQNNENCQPNYPYVEWPFLWRDKDPHAVTRTQDGQIKEQIPTQVVRLAETIESRKYEFNHRTKNPLKEISDATKNAIKEDNKKWQEAFKNNGNSVWQYYELLGTQWLSNPKIVIKDSHNELISKIRKDKIRPGALVNVSMEAYSQYQKNGDSCIGCHVTSILPRSNDGSQKAFSDFSFMLERAQSSIAKNSS